MDTSYELPTNEIDYLKFKLKEAQYTIFDLNVQMQNLACYNEQLLTVKSHAIDEVKDMLNCRTIDGALDYIHDLLKIEKLYYKKQKECKKDYESYKKLDKTNMKLRFQIDKMFDEIILKGNTCWNLTLERNKMEQDFEAAKVTINKLTSELKHYKSCYTNERKYQNELIATSIQLNQDVTRYKAEISLFEEKVKHFKERSEPDMKLNRNVTLPDLHVGESAPSSPASSMSRLSPLHPRTIPLAPGGLDANTFQNTAAFVPIRESYAAAPIAPPPATQKKEQDLIFQQQLKIQDRLKGVENSNQALLNEINAVKRLHMDNRQDSARLNADTMNHLSRKMQIMQEQLNKYELASKQQENTIMEDKGALVALADKLIDLETTSIASHDDNVL